MRKLIAAVLIVASVAYAGERYLGTIVATTVKSNDTTATPFYVSPTAKITIQCDAASYVLTDSNAALTTTNGIKVSADEKFPTSTATMVRIHSLTAADGGASVQALAVSGTSNCKVWERLGSE